MPQMPGLRFEETIWGYFAEGVDDFEQGLCVKDWGGSALMLSIFFFNPLSFSIFCVNFWYNGDGQVCKTNLDIVLDTTNTPADGLDDPRDLDGDGVIIVLDARKLVILYTRPRCACE